MNKQRWALALGGVLAAMAFPVSAQTPSTQTPPAQSAPGSDSCTNLALLPMIDAKIESARLSNSAMPTRAAPGEIQDATILSFCRVAGVATPTPHSSIHFEIWLPSKNWNGKFLGVGNAGLAGSINQAGMASALAGGFATASTDDGHQGPDTAWLSDPERVADFGHRAVHVTAVAAKQVIAAFYGKAQEHAYFFGCSKGGQEGMMEAARYPSDYEGIVAGAPLFYWSHLLSSWLWNSAAMAASPDRTIPAPKLLRLHNAVLDACDAADGRTDRLLETPQACTFDPAKLQCKGADGPDCLTAAQVETARAIYAGPQDPHTHAQLYPGVPRGSEASNSGAPTLGWGLYEGRLATTMATPILGGAVFDTPAWKWQQFDAARDMAKVDAALGPVLDANTDLAAFRAAGGKLILYNGWADPIAPASYPLEYYEKLASGGHGKADAAAFAKVGGFFRLFLVPGMGHCSGGDGPDSFDPVSPMDRWVEHGIGPDEIPATGAPVAAQGGSVRALGLLCPYPKTMHNSTDPADGDGLTCADPPATKP